MDRRGAGVLAASIVLLPFVMACGSDSTRPPGAPPPSARPATAQATDYAGLLERLRDAGLAVSPQGPLEQSILTGKGTALQANDALIQVFEYADPSSAEADAARVSPDGTKIGGQRDGAGATDVFWIEAPHFYKGGRLIVLYVGQDPAVLAALGAALGRQFAGG